MEEIVYNINKLDTFTKFVKLSTEQLGKVERKLQRMKAKEKVQQPKQ